MIEAVFIAAASGVIVPIAVEEVEPDFIVPCNNQILLLTITRNGDKLPDVTDKNINGVTISGFKREKKCSMIV
jgi:hypothetical protein